MGLCSGLTRSSRKWALQASAVPVCLRDTGSEWGSGWGRVGLGRMALEENSIQLVLVKEDNKFLSTKAPTCF